MERVELKDAMKTVMASIEDLRPRFEEVLVKHVGNREVNGKTHPVQWMMGTVSNLMMLYMSLVGGQLKECKDADTIKNICSDFLFTTALSLSVTTLGTPEVLRGYLSELLSPNMAAAVEAIRNVLNVTEDSPSDVMDNLTKALSQIGVDQG